MSTVRTVAASALMLGVAITTQAAEVPNVAFLGFQLINTSLEPTTPAERSRIELLDEIFAKQLDASGRFKIVLIPPELQKKIRYRAGDQWL